MVSPAPEHSPVWIDAVSGAIVDEGDEGGPPSEQLRNAAQHEVPLSTIDPASIRLPLRRPGHWRDSSAVTRTPASITRRICSTSTWFRTQGMSTDWISHWCRGWRSGHHPKEPIVRSKTSAIVSNTNGGAGSVTLHRENLICTPWGVVFNATFPHHHGSPSRRRYWPVWRPLYAEHLKHGPLATVADLEGGSGTLLPHSCCLTNGLHRSARRPPSRVSFPLRPASCFSR